MHPSLYGVSPLGPLQASTCIRAFLPTFALRCHLASAAVFSSREHKSTTCRLSLFLHAFTRRILGRGGAQPVRGPAHSPRDATHVLDSRPCTIFILVQMFSCCTTIIHKPSLIWASFTYGLLNRALLPYQITAFPEPLEEDADTDKSTRAICLILEFLRGIRLSAMYFRKQAVSFYRVRIAISFARYPTYGRLTPLATRCLIRHLSFSHHPDTACTIW